MKQVEYKRNKEHKLIAVGAYEIPDIVGQQYIHTNEIRTLLWDRGVCLGEIEVWEPVGDEIVTIHSGVRTQSRSVVNVMYFKDMNYAIVISDDIIYKLRKGVK